MKMRRCFTDPTIGRTLRSDALGKNWTLYDIVGCVTVVYSRIFPGISHDLPKLFTLQLSQARLLSTRLQRELQVHLASSGRCGMRPMKNGHFPFLLSQQKGGFFFMPYPLVYCHITMENHHFIAGKIHYFYGHFQ